MVYSDVECCGVLLCLSSAVNHYFSVLIVQNGGRFGTSSWSSMKRVVKILNYGVIPVYCNAISGLFLPRSFIRQITVFQSKTNSNITTITTITRRMKYQILFMGC